MRLKEPVIAAIGVAIANLFVCTSSSHAEEVKPLIEYSGHVRKGTLMKVAPASKFVTDQKSFEKVWKAWRRDKPIKVDFATEIPLIGYVGGPNRAHCRAVLVKGDLKVKFEGTERGGPGFGYNIGIFPRKGIKTVLGKPIEVKKMDDGDDAPRTGPVEPRIAFSDIVHNAKLAKLAPESQFITDQETLENVWKRWRRDESPDVDWSTEIVIIGTVPGPNDAVCKMDLADGNLKLKFSGDDRGGNAFGYRIAVISREGIKTVQGRPIAAEEKK